MANDRTDTISAFPKFGRYCNDRTDTISAYPNFGRYCDMVFLSRCFMNIKSEVYYKNGVEEIK